jgi:3',5'-cyclic AMP phosphodiesterase CpdA
VFVLSPEPVPAARCGDEEELPVVGGSFVVLGDLQPTSRLEAWRESNDPERALIVERIARIRPDFVALLGDLVFCGSSRSAWAGFDALWAPVAAAHVPTFPVLGNHEYWMSRNAGLVQFFRRFPRLRGRRWYAAKYGPVGLVFLDSNRHALTGFLWETQIRWLNRTLARLDASPEIRGVVVLLHHPPFTNSTVTSDARHVQRQILPFFTAAEKTLAMIAGHVHSYEHFARGGKHYIVAGGGGGPRVRLAQGRRRRHVDDAFGGAAVRSFHFLRLTPSSEGLEITVCGLEKGGGDFAPMERFRLSWPTAASDAGEVHAPSRVRAAIP